jgi:hypothetical protein
MVTGQPASELCAPFSGPGAVAVPWAGALEVLTSAEVFWLSTVRPDGRPHVTPLLAVWVDSALCFCTGGAERKAQNLAVNPSCTLTTGRNELLGLDVVLEGPAVPATDPAVLGSIASAFEEKYGPHLTAPDGTWAGLGDHIREDDVVVYRVQPVVAFGFAEGGEYSQTRWAFDHRPVPEGRRPGTGAPG